MKVRLSAIEAAVAMAEASTGTHKPGVAKIPLTTKGRTRGRYWTKDEEQFLKENLGKLSIQQIARHLGRSWSAIVNHYKREMHITVPSKDPRIVSAEQISLGIGKDAKCVSAMIDKGIMPGRRLPLEDQRVIRVVDKVQLLKWILDPENWCRFRPERVGQLKVGGKRRVSYIYDQKFWDQAAKVVRKARRKWKDQWLTTGQVAKRLHVTHHNINAAILKGNLKATRQQNWWVKRSDLPKKGTIDATGKWVPRILTHAERGKINSKIYWDLVHSGKKPMPPRGQTAKVKEREQFFELMGKKYDVLRATAAIGVSNPTGYKWLKEKYGANWHMQFAWTREFKKARFLELMRKGSSVKKAASGAGIHVESSYRWLHEEWGTNWKKKIQNGRKAA